MRWLAVLPAMLLAAAPAAAVELGPRLTTLDGGRLLAPAVRALTLPAAAPRPPLRLIATGPELDRFADRLAAAGHPVRIRAGVGRVDVPLAELATLRGPERVRVGLGARLRPLLSESLPAIGLSANLRSQRTGRGVLVAILDTGVDFTHPDFSNGDGSTRFVAYWDQTAEADDPEQFGVVCDALDINEGSCPNNAEEPLAGFLPSGHGTHVAGIAAGDDERFRGVAPEALLIGVRLNFEEAGLIDALNWVDEVAGQYGLPVVINLSLGANEGPHDGSAPSERIIDDLSGPGRIVVAAAGNEGPGSNESFIHTGSALDGSRHRTRFRTDDARNVEVFHAQVWGSPGSGVRAGLELAPDTDGDPATVLDATPAWDPEGLDDEGESVILRDGNDEVASVLVLPQETVDGAPGLFLEIAAEDGALGEYTFHLYWSGATGTGDAWLTDRVAYFDPVSGEHVLSFPGGTTARVPFRAGDSRQTITLPGTAREALTVSGFVTRNRWENVDGDGYRSESELGTLLNIASLGPTRDGRLKPDIAGPGEYIASTLGRDLDFFPDALKLDAQHGLQRGTSMASPHVAGVAALFLEGSPKLGPEDMKEVLFGLAVTDAFTGAVPNPDWGRGKLELAGVAGTPEWTAAGNGDATPPAITRTGVVAEGDGVVVTWLTDELGTSQLDTGGAALAGRLSFATRHRVRLGGELPDTLRIVSTDPAGNTARSASLDVPATGCGCSVPGSPPAAPVVPLLLAVVFWALLRHPMHHGRRQGGECPRAVRRPAAGPRHR